MLIDCQLASAHLASLGARLIPRVEFQLLLRKLTAFPSPRDWSRPPVDTAMLHAQDRR
jgi:leucyl/phenylalanyl-tRNA--protein transferase